jgi:hypothetical protein
LLRGIGVDVGEGGMGEGMGRGAAKILQARVKNKTTNGNMIFFQNVDFIVNSNYLKITDRCQ